MDAQSVRKQCQDTVVNKMLHAALRAQAYYVHNLAETLEVDEALLESDVAPDRLLHAQGQSPVLPVDVDGRDLVLDGAAAGLEPCHERLVSLQQVDDALGAGVLRVAPGLSAEDDVHVGDVEDLAWRR